jgi:2-methylisocitrate lyase-like PEP mutase family enzyme
MRDRVAAGVRRASVGPALMLAAYGAVEQALAHIRASGRFDFAPAGMSAREVARRVAGEP